MTKNISVLGSTGSIGTQTLDVADKLDLRVSALTAAKNIELLEQQVRKYKPELAVVYDEEKAREFKVAIADTYTKVLSGMDGLIEAARLPQADLVVNSVVGMVGLKPTIAAAEAKKDIAFANKETLVAGGDLVTDAVKSNGVKLLPVDSEHSAIFQCLQGMPDKKVLKKIILTASGGPFFGRKLDELRDVTVEQALAHPNWSMGAKITIDSATMMNKGLEIIEAGRLFDTRLLDLSPENARDTVLSLLEPEKDLPPEDLKNRYPEFQPYEGKCRFRQCLHDSEPGCAAAEAVRDGAVHPARWQRYRVLLAEARENWKNRYD